MISGTELRDAIISAANAISNQRQQVDALNVFPVPDGDTGSNMSMTMSSAKRELELISGGLSASEVSHIAASALLRGARGNSGVILSLLFRGFSKGLSQKEYMSSQDIAVVLELGAEAAYKAVMKPTEGTILTVARMASEGARAAVKGNPGIDPVSLWERVIQAATQALDSTPDLLPVLKDAGVVDAGGKGLVVIYEGMAEVFRGKGIQQLAVEKEISEVPEKNAAGEYVGEITFTYCTEFVILQKEKNMDASPLREYLETIGDCVVVVEDGDIIKCHVHTDDPGNALQRSLEFGQLTRIKIENMREQHASNKRQAPQKTNYSYVMVDPSREYGFVAVCAGDGISDLFRDLGVETIVNGGQTMNPSTEDILAAVQATPAKTVFVLPNNKNIIMAAEQAVPLADRQVHVVHTRNIPQGIAAMLSFNPEGEMEENQMSMVKAIERVGCGQITFAARDSVFDGHKIKNGELLALENGKLAFIERDMAKAVMRLTRSLLKKSSSFVTLISGEGITQEEGEETAELLRSKIGDRVDINLIHGGQPVYYYIISVE